VLLFQKEPFCGPDKIQVLGTLILREECGADVVGQGRLPGDWRRFEKVWTGFVLRLCPPRPSPPIPAVMAHFADLKKSYVPCHGSRATRSRSKIFFGRWGPGRELG
jgi:hypothetical protein